FCCAASLGGRTPTQAATSRLITRSMSRTVGYELARFNKAFTPSMDALATTGSADMTGVGTIVWNRFSSARSPSMKTGCVSVVVGLHEVAADRFKSARSGVTDCARAVL